ncbi:MAG: RNA polymerase subunit sigma [Actinobacteria bacterium 13_2_20CM_2_71_6]|nr:MAG: RNA polymerase subunit sigma [Actinobacteria bacterium 13_2_20CM_2_71_6]
MDARAEQEFTQFVADRTPALLRVAHALTGDQHAAEDLVQGALAKAMLRWPHIHDHPEAYVRRILYHDHISGWRQRRRRPETPMAELPELPGSDGTDEAHTRMLLRNALLELPPRQRAVIVLRYLDDHSEREVAEILGCREGTVASQASRALAKLRRLVPAQWTEAWR